jgi:small subunit ribosomal protein S12
MKLLYLIKKPREKKVFRQKNQKLCGSPQKKVTCLNVYTTSPKKPNSANRQVADVMVSRSKNSFAVKINGVGNNLQQYSICLIRGARVKDLVGINYSAIRGKYDHAGVISRKTSRSRYGVKKI